MAVSQAAAGSFPVIPQLSVLHSRRCADEGDVNCFTSLQGCNSTVEDSLRCDDPDGWSVSLVFVGTGAEIPWSSNCTTTSCMWSIDDFDCGWKRGAVGPMVYAEGLMGGDDSRHTLTVSSPEGSAILQVDYATIHTGLDTPVHAEDDIWIPASSNMFDYQGNWEEVIHNPSERPPVSRTREMVDGNGSVSIDVIADRFHFRHWSSGPTSNYSLFPNWTTAIDGEIGEARRQTGPLELTPEGRHNLTLMAADPEFFSSSEKPFTMEFAGLSYHPLSNVSRIRDVTPPDLVEAAENFDYSEMVGTDTQCRDMVDDADDSEGGAFGLHGGTVGTMGLVSSVFASYVVWLALCT